MTLPTFSEPVQGRRDDGTPEFKLTISGSNDSSVQHWIKANTDQVVLGYFKAVSSGLQQRGLQHYHLRIHNGRFDRQTRRLTPWSCVVLYGEQDAAADTHALRGGPLEVARCMSCDLDCPLLLGITGEDPDAAAPGSSGSSLRQQRAGTSGSPATEAQTATDNTAAAAAPQSEPVAASTPAADAAPAEGASQQQQDLTKKQQQQQPQQQPQQQEPAQSQLPQQPQQPQHQVVLRSRHSLVRESAHCRVWFDAKGRPMFVVTPKQHIETLAQLSDAALLDLWRTTAAVLDAMRVGCNAMILNQGDNRNHAHLHLKIRVPEQQFSRAVASWPQQQQQQLRAIWAFRDSLPAEHRGTREAYLLRLQQAQAARRQHSEDE